LAPLLERLFQPIRIGSSPISNSTVMRRRRSRRRGAKSALAFALSGAPRGAQKSVVSPVPSTSSSWFQLEHHSRMSVFSGKRKEILSENVRIQEGYNPIEFQVETAGLRGEDRCANGRCRDTKSAVKLCRTGILLQRP